MEKDSLPGCRCRWSCRWSCRCRWSCNTMSREIGEIVYVTEVEEAPLQVRFLVLGARFTV